MPPVEDVFRNDPARKPGKGGEAEAFAKDLAGSADMVFRTLSGEKDVRIAFRTGGAGPVTMPPDSDGRTLFLPEKIEAGTPEGRRRARAEIDTAAAWVARHDADIHRNHTPETGRARRIYNALEKARCEALFGRDFKGAAANMEQTVRDYVLDEAPQDSAAQQALGAVYMMALEKISGDPLKGPNGEFVASQKKTIDKKMLSRRDRALNVFKRLAGRAEKTVEQQVADLAVHAENEEEYAKRAAALSDALAPLFDIEQQQWTQEKSEKSRREEEKSRSGNGQGQSNQSQNSEGKRGQDKSDQDKSDQDKSGRDGKGDPSPSSPQEPPDQEQEDRKDAPSSETLAPSPTAARPEDRPQPEEVSLREAFQAKADHHADDGKTGTVPRPLLLDPQEVDPDYKIFTKEFDRVVSGGEFAAKEGADVAVCRQELDMLLQSQDALVSRLAVRLQRKLMAMQRRSWACDLDDGKLDPARLARIVADPRQPLAYREEKESPFRETAVTILVDNSGSMQMPRDKINMAAMTADTLARVLERAGIGTEILGFTTAIENLSREKYLRLSKATAGRVEDLVHVVYKRAGQPYRRCREDIAAMLGGCLLENVDGEALAWAYNRLIARPEERKILLVVSDGAPYAKYKDKYGGPNPMYLSYHLKKVVKFIEQKTPVELAAIGIGNDVGEYYKNAVTIHKPSQLAPVLIGKLDALFDPPEKAARRVANRKALRASL